MRIFDWRFIRKLFGTELVSSSFLKSSCEVIFDMDEIGIKIAHCFIPWGGKSFEIFEAVLILDIVCLFLIPLQFCWGRQLLLGAHLWKLFRLFLKIINRIIAIIFVKQVNLIRKGIIFLPSWPSCIGD